MKVALLALLLALAVAGCGAEESTDMSPGAGTAAAPTSSEEPATSLTIEVALTGFDKGVSNTTTLECDPVGGTNPLQDEACAQLAAHPEALEPVPENAACTMIFGGPDEARVYGTFEGEEIDAEFSKANGCELARWESLEPLFKVVVG